MAKKNPAYTKRLVQQAMKLRILMVDFHEIVLPAISICIRQLGNICEEGSLRQRK